MDHSRFPDPLQRANPFLSEGEPKFSEGDHFFQFGPQINFKGTVFQTSLSALFQLPDDMELVSGVYWISFPAKMVEFQSYTHNTSPAALE